MAYNAVITGSFIDISSLQEPVIEVETEGDPRRVSLQNTRTHRIFSRSNWQMNGWFYGGWWQQIDSDWRAKITIDTQPTIEAAMRGCTLPCSMQKKV